ncbi:thioredoxin domain-containing protein [Desulfitobacterium sp.]|uniref:thioredoxin domain-containing protein n=1 Tax=Desulfitobacterium sp. TaxID=49981 RepID=UPI002BD31420|nr:thioredoxin domain-containing protein [Desulfitobacterium sp.]HVJ47797.1 thioredoxin domain-containing protein [Desulfitobacterium sp.]
MVHTSKQANKLINEKSPYLLQHAYNPVDWYPWNEEAFAVAEKDNKPIFLSIGYSTCHWCHVMERESFEDSEVAKLLNRYFVAIKVDREERPDIDHLYMEFCQALTGSGGWPLTVLMTPEKRPFYAGTYFPKHSRYGRPGLMDLLSQIGELWEKDEGKLRKSAEEIVKAVTSREESTPREHESQDSQALQGFLKAQTVGDASSDFQSWASELIEQAYQALAQNFDSHYGGFSQAPKFPSPHNLTFLLRYAKDHPERPADAMIRKTLDSMGKGGIYDHIGFGFARYSTDQKWLVPHFEKMLYDNALLAIAYLEAYQSQKAPQDAQKAQEIFAYVLRDMTSPGGGFYSAEDADSEGVEGKFYVWTPEEVATILGEERAALFCEVFDITPGGNFEGKSIPSLRSANTVEHARKHNLNPEAFEAILEEDRQKLWHSREKRVHPHKDDKILTSWNGLMIAALSKGGQILGEEKYIRAAEQAVQFLLKNLYPQERLLARFREGNAAYLGYLDDYAFFIWGLLELYMACGKSIYLKTALSLQEQLEFLFIDEEAGGYYLTGSDAEELLIRPKEIYDGALPSGNSITALNLLRLARLTGEDRWESRAEKQLLSFRSALSTYPAGYTAFLQALQFALQPSQELLFVGPLNHAGIPSLRQTFFAEFLPYSSLLYHEGTLGKLLPWVQDYPFDPNKVLAYLCENFTCQKPVEDPGELYILLKS